MGTPLQRVGPYRILDVLGRGGMGVVYRAEHAASGARVALKMVSALDPLRLEGLRREIHALARLRHPGIVRVLEEGLHMGEPWCAMELLEGATLDLFLLREGRHKALSVLPLVCDALSYLHGEGIVHRDLKPANVLVTAADRVVLLDFGLAEKASIDQYVAHAGLAGFDQVEEATPISRADPAGALEELVEVLFLAPAPRHDRAIPQLDGERVVSLVDSQQATRAAGAQLHQQFLDRVHRLPRASSSRSR